MARRGTLTPLALATLELLHEAPKHPYDIHQTMRDRHVDRLVKLTAGTLYHTIDRLARDGLIETVETSREGRRPERTTYRLTAAGRDQFAERLRAIVAAPADTFPEFGVAIGMLHKLEPADGTKCLRRRATELRSRVASRRVWVDQLTEAGTPEMYWMDLKYRLAMDEAELAWVGAQLDRLASGELAWPPGKPSPTGLRVVRDESTGESATREAAG
ncbi:MAG TPA: PadR family transcriptional regulator [Pseudonocardiaceae bacterium]|jgi:DNA-binding PadR family transcriptional regulator|nr:PadR family transcriptional regulator [Pseudonocardiaceae bacterium]